MPGYDLGTISRKDVSAMMTPSNMKGVALVFAQRPSPLERLLAGLGFWGAGATCPAGAYASASQRLGSYAGDSERVVTEVTGAQIKKMKDQEGERMGSIVEFHAVFLIRGAPLLACRRRERSQRLEIPVQ